MIEYLDYLLAKHTSVCTMADTISCTCTQLNKITRLKKVSLSTGSYFALFDFDWFGFWGTWLWSALQILEIILLIRIIVISLVCCILPKASNACSQLLTTRQMISLRWRQRQRGSWRRRRRKEEERRRGKRKRKMRKRREGEEEKEEEGGGEEEKKENVHLKTCETEVVAYEYHRD